ncbi:hypothetical protein ACPPVO_28625 [Dactylosporangium sp. McL0621]|uniref:hypothetical protein n=1 Tax=Dactylosporangium sp. McL0621 TaxID=3415678 RepID=UPI003CF0DF90
MARMLVVTVCSAASYFAALSLRLLADEPHTGWNGLALTVAAAVATAVGTALPQVVLGGHRREFVVRPGRFVAPSSPALRATVQALALATFALIPVVVRHVHVLRLGADTPAIVGFGTLGVVGVLAAVRCWQYTVVLDPGGVTVHAFASPADRAPWEKIRAGRVEGRAFLRAVDPAFIERAIRALPRPSRASRRDRYRGRAHPAPRRARRGGTGAKCFAR